MCGVCFTCILITFLINLMHTFRQTHWCLSGKQTFDSPLLLRYCIIYIVWPWFWCFAETFPIKFYMWLCSIYWKRNWNIKDVCRTGKRCSILNIGNSKESEVRSDQISHLQKRWHWMYNFEMYIILISLSWFQQTGRELASAQREVRFMNFGITDTYKSKTVCLAHNLSPWLLQLLHGRSSD